MIAILGNDILCVCVCMLLGVVGALLELSCH
jgi:hypothetical protein